MGKDTKNRIIKFRGKGIYSDEWKFGDLLQYESGEMAILENKFSKYGYEATEIYKRNQVISDTIGQFTGKTDKSKKEIYEGDILKHGRNGRLYLVKFFNGMFYASVEECNKNIYGGFPLYVLTDEEDEYKCEVVGNTFDNKELLKRCRIEKPAIPNSR